MKEINCYAKTCVFKSFLHAEESLNTQVLA